MHTDWTWLDLALPLIAAVLFGLGHAAWRVRTTRIGRGFVALVVLAGGAAALGLVSRFDAESSAFLIRALATLTACTGAAVLRLGLLAIAPTRPLSIGREAAIWLPAVLIGLLGSPLLQGFWIAGVDAVSAYRLHRVPRRSGQSFDSTLWFIRLATVVTGLVSFAAIVVSTGITAALVPPVAHLSLAGVLYYALPQLGLLAQDRVQHRSVIQAMSDGVMVVDLDDRVLELNQSARNILGIEQEDLALEPLASVLAQHPDLVELCRGAIEGHTLYAPRSAAGSDENRTYDLRLSALHDA